MRTKKFYITFENKKAPTFLVRIPIIPELKPKRGFVIAEQHWVEKEVGILMPHMETFFQGYSAFEISSNPFRYWQPGCRVYECETLYADREIQSQKHYCLAYKLGRQIEDQPFQSGLLKLIQVFKALKLFAKKTRRLSPSRCYPTFEDARQALLQQKKAEVLGPKNKISWDEFVIKVNNVEGHNLSFWNQICDLESKCKKTEKEHLTNRFMFKAIETARDLVSPLGDPSVSPYKEIYENLSYIFRMLFLAEIWGSPQREKDKYLAILKIWQMGYGVYSVEDQKTYSYASIQQKILS